MYEFSAPRSLKCRWHLDITSQWNRGAVTVIGLCSERIQIPNAESLRQLGNFATSLQKNEHYKSVIREEMENGKYDKTTGWPPKPKKKLTALSISVADRQLAHCPSTRISHPLSALWTLHSSRRRPITVKFGWNSAKFTADQWARWYGSLILVKFAVYGCEGVITDTSEYIHVDCLESIP